MNLSGNQKLGALLAGILPLVASIYGQQAERRQENQTRAAEQQALVDAERRASGESDSASAKQLNEAFKQVANQPAGGASRSDDLCSTLHTSLELLRQSAPTPKTEAVIAAWLTYRVERDGRRLVCDCKRTIGIAYSNWLPDASSDGKSVHNELIFALNAANTECNPDQAQADWYVAGPQSPTRVPATPTASRATVPAQPTRGQGTPPPLPPSPAPPPTPAVDLTKPKPGARIYFQVPDEAAKGRIGAVRLDLERAGYRVHEVEVVGANRAPRCAELRYVYVNDTSEATALRDDLNKPAMLSQLYDSNLPDPALREFRIARMSRYEGHSLNRVYEVWLPRNGGQECKQ